MQECVVRNRVGQEDYTPLVPAVQERVKELVGEDRWNKHVETVRKARELQARQTSMMRLDSMDYPAQVAQV